MARRKVIENGEPVRAENPVETRAGRAQTVDEPSDADLVLVPRGEDEEEPDGPMAEFEASPAGVTVTIPVSGAFQRAFVELLLNSCSPLARQTASDTILHTFTSDPEAMSEAVRGSLERAAENMISMDKGLLAEVVAKMRAAWEQVSADMASADGMMARMIRNAIRAECVLVIRSREFAEMLKAEALANIRRELPAIVEGLAGGRDRLAVQLRGMVERAASDATERDEQEDEGG